MTPELYQRATELFLAVVDLDQAQRDAFLDDACGRDRELRSAVESLLSHDSQDTLIDSQATDDTVPFTISDGSQIGRSSRWLLTAWLTRYLSPRGQFALGAFAAVLLLVMLASCVGLGLAKFQKTFREQALREILDAKIAGLEMWIEFEREKVASWTRSHAVRDTVLQLVDLAANDQNSVEQIRTSPLQDELRDVIFRLAGEEVSYQLWNRNHDTIADEPGRLAIGSGVTAFGSAVLTEVFRGKAHILVYDKEQQISLVQSAIYENGRSGTITPLRDADDKIVAAVFIVDHHSHEQVARIFRLVDLGKSGETYAFTKDGLLLTPSRFDDQLRRIGLIPDEPDTGSARVVQLRDPGGDLTKGYKPVEPLAVRPLTKMAQYATAGVDGVDLDGYRDYRGVMVVGAWRWLDEYQCGVATELDRDEMEPGLWLFIAQAWVIFGLFAVCLGVIGYSYYSLYRQRQLAGENLQIGPYTIQEKIGEGGMGRVFKAKHAQLKRPTAIKMLKPDLIDRDSVARFEREAQLASQLTHPNTIQIYDYGVTDKGLFYYVMEYADGPSFAEEVERRGALPADRVIRLLEQVCGSLIEAHGLGLIHRDLKPRNLLLCRRGGMSDVVKVVDFGLVKELDPEAALTMTMPGLLAGTPLYIAPERLRDPTSAAATTDIYSLGAVAYYMLTGQEVFHGKSLADVLYQAAHVDPVRLGEIVTGVPAALEQLVMDCLAKQPEDRPQSVAELLERLRGAEINA